jgi:hypothetical protein
MARNSRQVQTPEAGNAGLSIRCAGTGKQRHDSQRFLELGDEHVGVDPVFNPPPLFTAGRVLVRSP